MTHEPNPVKKGGTILRFPRLAKSVDDELKAERKRLTVHAFVLFGKRCKIRIKLGRTFIRLKATFPHGGWEFYYGRTFGSSHVSLRTVQRWMRLARKTNGNSKNDETSHFKQATDREAVDIHNATARVKAELGNQTRMTPTPEPVKSQNSPIYRLPLHLTEEQRVRAEELRQSLKWPQVEKRLIDFLGQLHCEFRRANNAAKRTAS